jgi:hypothetical protein
MDIRGTEIGEAAVGVPEKPVAKIIITASVKPDECVHVADVNLHQLEIVIVSVHIWRKPERGRRNT